MIEARGLSKTYPDGTVALQGVDLELSEGMFGLLGPNGAGKTTLLSILVLALEPSTGTRRYFGLEDRKASRRRIRAQIGYLPQEFAPVAQLSGLEYLRYCAELRQVPLRRRDLERRLLALLDAVELGAAANRRAGTYSGGMKRRLGLAQALVHAPRFLVVDEPTAGLDPEERIRFRNLITELADDVPVLLSTHIVEDIEATCSRVAVLEGGRLLFDGTPGEILRRASGRIWRLPDGTEPPPGMEPLGRRLEQAGGRWRLYAARGSDAAGGPVALSAEPVEPTLEEAYAVFLTDADADTTEVAA